MVEAAECSCDRPVKVKRLEASGWSDWFCHRCGLALPESAQPAPEAHALMVEARALGTFGAIVDRFGEPDRSSSEASLQRFRDRLKQIPSDHRGAAAAARQLARPPVREARWRVGSLVLTVWAYADGTIETLVVPSETR